MTLSALTALASPGTSSFPTSAAAVGAKRTLVRYSKPCARFTVAVPPQWAMQNIGIYGPISDP